MLNASQVSLALAVVFGAPVAAVLGYLCYKSAFREAVFEGAKDSSSSDVKKAENTTADIVQRSKGQHENVIKECTIALELNPINCKLLSRRARSYEAVEDLKSALEDITVVCCLESFMNQSNLQAADRLLRNIGKKNAKGTLENRKPSIPSKNHVKTYLSSFLYDPVLTNLEVTTNNNNISNDSVNGLDRAINLLQEGKYAEVIAACKKELSNSGADDYRKRQAELLIATMNILCDQRVEALEQLTAIIDTKNIHSKIAVNALIKRATLYFQIQSIEMCFKDFDKAVGIDQNVSDIYYHRGQIHILMDQIEKAKSDYLLALSKSPNSSTIAAHKCYIDFCATQTNGRAISTVENCLENSRVLLQKYPKCAECHLMHVQALMAMKDYQNADHHIEEALKIQPTDANLHVHRGLLQLQWPGNHEQAVGFIERAIELDHRCDLAYETLGSLEVQKGNLEGAIVWFDKAIDTAKTEVEITHSLSLKYAAEALMNVAVRFDLGGEKSRSKGTMRK